MIGSPFKRTWGIKMEYRYLIVDDEVLIRRGIRNRIDSIKSLSLVCVGEASNGEKAKEIIADKKPDIIITDMKMAKVDGVELLNYLEKNAPDSAVIVASGYTDFAYVSKALEKRVIGYLLKPFSAAEIEEQLKKAVQSIEQRKSLQELKRRVVSFEEKFEQFKLLEIMMEPWSGDVERELADKNYVMDYFHLLISISTNDETVEPHVRERCLTLLKGIQGVVLNNPSNKFQFFVILTAEGEGNREKLSVQASRMAMEVKRCVQGRKAFVCISNVFQGFSQLNRNYQRNEELLGRISLRDTVGIFRAAQEVYEPKEIAPANEVKDMFRMIKHNYAEADNLCGAFFEKIDPESHLIGDIRRYCDVLIECVNQYADQKGVETDNVMEIFVKRYIYCDDTEKMEREITGYVKLVMDSIRMKSNDEEYMFDRMKRYIVENFDKKLTLQVLADHFYMSPNACSEILKQKMNISFNDFLKEIRIGKAKELLDTTELSAEKISEEIGYANAKYFFKIFKKETGSTPSEYRNRKK